MRISWWSGALLVVLTGCFEVPPLPPAGDADMCTGEGCDPGGDFCEECLELIEDPLCEEVECDGEECEISLRVECPMGQRCERGQCVGGDAACSSPMDCPMGTGCEIPTCMNNVCGIGQCPNNGCYLDQCWMCQSADSCPDRACHTKSCMMGLCAYAPVDEGADCNDGIFCNGPDGCNAFGECMPRFGTNPCLEGQTCDEEADACSASPGNGCPQACMGADDECSRGICVENACEPSPLPDGATCGLQGTCRDGACHECEVPADCLGASECVEALCIDSLCTYRPAVGDCSAGVGRCVDGFCQLGCLADAVCLTEGLAGCYDPDGAGGSEGFCAQCTEQADCAAYASPLCVDGQCTCTDNLDCGHLTIDGCDYADECARDGDRVMRSTVGVCDQIGCVAEPANGPCRRQTDGFACDEGAGICSQGRCEAVPQVTVEVTCTAESGWFRLQCDGIEIHSQACAFETLAVTCPANATFHACCAGFDEPCGPGIMRQPPEMTPAYNRDLTVAPLTGSCEAMPPFDRHCSGTLEADTTIDCAQGGPGGMMPGQ